MCVLRTLGVVSLSSHSLFHIEKFGTEFYFPCTHPGLERKAIVFLNVVGKIKTLHLAPKTKDELKYRYR